jgi:hypothetical protein
LNSQSSCWDYKCVPPHPNYLFFPKLHCMYHLIFKHSTYLTRHIMFMSAFPSRSLLQNAFSICSTITQSDCGNNTFEKHFEKL